jgi:tRNA dimethylallyltransferase
MGSAKLLYLITGCTAVGKTAYAIDFAEKNNCEIVSCDSLLVYKHMDIGTAKPTAEMMARVRHHCIDLVEPCEKFDVASYVAAAKGAINSISAIGKNAAIVGGSGFYLKSFYAPVADGISVGQDIKNFIADVYRSSGLEGIGTMLLTTNGGLRPSIDMKNPRRVMAALGRCLASGRTHGELTAEFSSQLSPFASYARRTILLEMEGERLRSAVRRRTAGMIADGLVDEVKFLLSNYEVLSDGARNAIGYRETAHWLKNPTTERALAEEISCSTMRLIKKQRTWFRTQIAADEIVSC